jgi:hypothetical protein
MAFVSAVAVAAAIVIGLHVLAEQVSPTTGNAGLKRTLEEGEMPFTNLVLVLGGWLVAAWVGGTIASRVSRQRGPLLVFTVLATAMLVVDFRGVPHPTWMWIAGVCGVPLLALGAAGESITVR